MKFAHLLLIIILFSVFSCKKNDRLEKNPEPENVSMYVRTDEYFPKGVLVVKNQEIFRELWYITLENKNHISALFKGELETLNDYIESFRIKKNENAYRGGFDNVNTYLEEVSLDEYLVDMSEEAIPDENFGNILNQDMELIVADTLYKFSRIGLLKIEIKQLPEFTEIYEQNEERILFDDSFVRFPGETFKDPTTAGSVEYLVKEGIVRVDNASDGDILMESIKYMDDGGGCTNCDSNGYQTGNNPTDYFVNSSVGKSYKSEVAIAFNDWGERRLVFKTKKTNIPFVIGMFNSIGIKGKVQKRKKFLGIKYWGPSNADEIIVGCDNMSLETDFIFPYPQLYNALSRPKFNKLAKFKFGNHILDVFDLDINLSAANFVLTNQEVASLIDSRINKLIGNTYTDIFKLIERKLINSIDPTYLLRYENYTTRVNSLDDKNRLKWMLGRTEKAEGYEHKNEWVFDWNLGGSYKENGGVGGQELKYNYRYTMKAGSFFVRARVGSTWHGIRIVIV